MDKNNNVAVPVEGSGSSPAVSSTNESFPPKHQAIGGPQYDTYPDDSPIFIPEVEKMEAYWTRQNELAGIRHAPYDPRSRWERLGMWRLIATIVQRRSLRAWQRLRWRMSTWAWDASWVFSATTEHKKRWGWLGLALLNLSFWLRYPESEGDMDDL
jgi:hypothetical protein